MTEANRLLDDTRIASPCRASWDLMTGDDTVRFCGECRLNVYNISNMTALEAATLVERSDGRLCVRLYRRKDGTVLTRDCPVGLRAAVRRASRAAGAALTALLGLVSGAAARTAWAGSGQEAGGARCAAPESRQEPPAIMGKIAPPRRGDEVTVSVVDDRGAPVAGAEPFLTDLRTGEFVAAAPSGEGGRYRFAGVEPGLYTLSVTAPGYEPSRPKTVRVRRGKPADARVVLREAPEPLLGEIAPGGPGDPPRER